MMAGRWLPDLPQDALARWPLSIPVPPQSNPNPGMAPGGFHRRPDDVPPPGRQAGRILKPRSL